MQPPDPAARPAGRTGLLTAGAEAFARGDFAAAERAFDTALALAPGDRALRFALGHVYEATARVERALATYAEIVAADPRDVATLLRVGLVQFVHSRFREACVAFASVLAIEPRHALAARSFGIAAAQLGEFADAVAVLQTAVTVDAANPDAWSALADALRGARRPAEAVAAAERALALDGRSVGALVARGWIAFDAADFAGALGWFERAAAAAPADHAPALNLAVVHHRLGRVAEALERGAAAVALAPENPTAHFNLGMTALLGGDFATGFHEQEWRLRDPRRVPSPAERLLPRWDGGPLAGGALLVTREQGLGDFILWSRFFPALRARAGRLLVETPAPLFPLYRAAMDGIGFVAEALPAERVAAGAAFLPLCSIGEVLALRRDAIPAPIPYLRAEPARVAEFRARFAARGKRRNVGIVWGGNPQHSLDALRSCSVAAFGALAGAGDIAWFSLQQGPREPEAASAPAELDLVALGPELRDFATTAAAIAALDLVISVDTAVAHAAGALGVPVWILHGVGHFWVWGTESTTTPWYPTMRMFRQPVPADWSGLFAAVRDALQRWSSMT